MIQISFTDFTLFEDAPEFYATYKLINEKNGKQVYTDKFIISNIDLTKIDLATDEDKKWGIDIWARVFTSKSWEELQMIATESKSAEQAVSSIWQLTEDERIREEIWRREEQEGYQQYMVDRIASLTAQHEQDQKQHKQDQEKIEQLQNLVDELSKELGHHHNGE